MLIETCPLLQCSAYFWRHGILCRPGYTLQWRHNGRTGVSNHQPHDCLLNRLFRLRSKKTSKLRLAGLCVRNSPVTGEFPAQMASNAKNVSIWWRHHVSGRVRVCNRVEVKVRKINTWNGMILNDVIWCKSWFGIAHGKRHFSAGGLVPLKVFCRISADWLQSTAPISIKDCHLNGQ